MSGRKCSSYSLNSAREQQSAALDSLVRSRRDISQTRQRIAEAIAKASPGVLRKFSKEVEQSRAWLARVEALSDKECGMSDPLADVQRESGSLASLSREGATLLGQQTTCFDRKAGELRTDLKKRLTRVRSSFETYSGVIGKWVGGQSEAELRSRIDQAQADVDQDEFDRADGLLRDIDERLGQSIKAAETREGDMVGRQFDGVLGSVGKQVSSASDGLRTTFTDETTAAQAWLTSVRNAGFDSSAPNAMAEIDRVRKLVEAGQAVADKLRDVYETRATDMRTGFSRRIEGCAASVHSDPELWKAWLGEDQLSRFEQQMSQLQGTVDANRLRDVEAPLAALESEIAQKSTFIDEQEAKHRRRLYLLKSLRQVCSEMRFKEVEAPRYEREGDRNSRVSLVVNTFNHGNVTFTLSLDSIEADSCISETHCYDEFTELSSKIEQMFGVNTEFKMDNGDPLPQRIEQGALEEPQPSNVSRPR